MIIKIESYYVNPDHIIRLGIDPNGRVLLVTSEESFTMYDLKTQQEVSDEINRAIRREKQKDCGHHMEFTPRGLE
jgi:hypothetical protein